MAKTLQYRETEGPQRLYRIEPTPEGRFRVLRLGLCYPPFTNEGIRAAMAAEGPQRRWYLLEEAHTEARAFAVASLHARSGGGFVPLERRYWKAVN